MRKKTEEFLDLVHESNGIGKSDAYGWSTCVVLLAFVARYCLYLGMGMGTLNFVQRVNCPFQPSNVIFEDECTVET